MNEGDHNDVLLTPVALFQAIAARPAADLFEPLVRLAEYNVDPLRRGTRITAFLLDQGIRALPMLTLSLQGATYRPQAIKRPGPARPYVIDTKMPLPQPSNVAALVLPANVLEMSNDRLHSSFIALAAPRGQSPQIYTLQMDELTTPVAAALRVGVALTLNTARHGSLKPYKAA